MSHFDEVDRRKRAERQRGQRIADVKHPEVCKIAGVSDNFADLADFASASSPESGDADQTSSEFEFRLIDF